MILGMSLAITMVHAIISPIAIAAGLIVMFGMLGSKRMPALTAIFLAFTVLTSASGFLFPPLLFEKLSPGHVIGILSLVLLAIACLALYGMKLAGAWRWIYALTALISLYLTIGIDNAEKALVLFFDQATRSIAPNSTDAVALIKRVIAVKMDYARKLARSSDLTEATALQFAYCRVQVEITIDLIRIISDHSDKPSDTSAPLVLTPRERTR